MRSTKVCLRRKACTNRQSTSSYHPRGLKHPNLYFCLSEQNTWAATHIPGAPRFSPLEFSLCEESRLGYRRRHQTHTRCYQLPWPCFARLPYSLKGAACPLQSCPACRNRGERWKTWCHFYHPLEKKMHIPMPSAVPIAGGELHLCVAPPSSAGLRDALVPCPPQPGMLLTGRQESLEGYIKY